MPVPPQSPPPDNASVTLNLSTLQDGSGAVLTFSLFGVWQVQTIIPRMMVLGFLKEWVLNEKQIQDINRTIAKEKLHA